MRLTIFAVMALLLTGCYVVKAQYVYDYKMVDPPPMGGPMILDDGKTRLSFAVTETAVAIEVVNNDSGPVSIIWDETSIVRGGEALRVFHNGVKYIDREQHQPPTVIPPGARISDAATPTVSASYFEGAGWIVHHLFPTRVYAGEGEAAARRQIEANVGKELALFLAIDHAGQRTNYNVKFRVEKVRNITPPKTQP